MKKSKKELLRDYIFADSEYDREDIIKDVILYGAINSFPPTRISLNVPSASF